MIKYCNKCGARYTEYINDKRTKCADCLAKESKSVNLTPNQIMSLYMDHDVKWPKWLKKGDR
jgi:protein-arginine kinase activator protein McsA